jgi:hypothetical protein
MPLIGNKSDVSLGQGQLITQKFRSPLYSNGYFHVETLSFCSEKNEFHVLLYRATFARLKRLELLSQSLASAPTTASPFLGNHAHPQNNPPSGISPPCARKFEHARPSKYLKLFYTKMRLGCDLHNGGKHPQLGQKSCLLQLEPCLLRVLRFPYNRGTCLRAPPPEWHSLYRHQLVAPLLRTHREAPRLNISCPWQLDYITSSPHPPSLRPRAASGGGRGSRTRRLCGR